MSLDAQFHSIFFSQENSKTNKIIESKDATNTKTSNFKSDKHSNYIYRAIKRLPVKENIYGHSLVQQSDPSNFSETPLVQITKNPSNFAIFFVIRQAVLKDYLKKLFFDNKQIHDGTCIEDSFHNDEHSKYDGFPKIPKVVGIGLCLVFELIRDSRLIHPSLCSRALHALLDMLQGQYPESLKGEPKEVINSLFEILLDLSSQNTSSKPDSPTSCNSQMMTGLMKSFSCSSLLSLVVARGDTDKILTAICSILTNSNNLQNDEIEIPNILLLLQRSVYSVMLGKTSRPYWLSNGCLVNSLCDSFYFQNEFGSKNLESHHLHHRWISLAFDGKYLYLFHVNTIYKIGSGYGDTLKGCLIISRKVNGIKPDGQYMGWLGCINGYLYFQSNNWTRNELIKIDCETLKEIGKVVLGINQWGPSAGATDGENLLVITAAKDDSFILRVFKHSTAAPTNSSSNYLMPMIQEYALKLAHRSLIVYGGIGNPIFDIEEFSCRESSQDFTNIVLNEEDTAQLALGKEFAVIRTSKGKVYFNGKGPNLGFKHSGCPGKWVEFPIPKSPKILHISAGHESSHLLLVADDGSVYFSGLAKRGEDGEQWKGRRQPKPVKPKKINKLEGKTVVFCACNHGTSALITKNGEVYMFGKDASHADKTTGQVVALRGEHIISIALGKAHTVALTEDGSVYTFGYNHKGQCGYDYSHLFSNISENASSSNLKIEKIQGPEVDTHMNFDSTLDISDDIESCSVGNHKWKYDKCMLCTSCGECTGYGSKCIAISKLKSRNPGTLCGCGTGESGCSECGICRVCDIIGKGASSNAYIPDQFPSDKERNSKYQSNSSNEYEEVSIMESVPPILQRINSGLSRRVLDSQLKWKLDGQYKHFTRICRNLVNNGDKVSEEFNISNECTYNSEMKEREEIFGSDYDSSKLCSVPPIKLKIGVKIIQIACGLYHSVLLTLNGEVYCFGSNHQGQLGLGDFLMREVPTKLELSGCVEQIAAGNYHTVLLMNDGSVVTFGSNSRGQLGRTSSAIDYCWNGSPGLIPGIGPTSGKKATWIGASGDYTFIKLDESLINPSTILSARVMANKRCLVIIPPNEEGKVEYNSLIINRADGSCKSFSGKDQINFDINTTGTLDSIFDLLWTYNSNTQLFCRYNIIYSSIKQPNIWNRGIINQKLPSMLSPEFTLPNKNNLSISRSTVALNLLCTLDTLTTAYRAGIIVRNGHSKNEATKIYSKNDFSLINRFEGHGGGWGYSDHSIEAIRFMVDTDILLGGMALFGGRGEYIAKIRLYYIGVDDQEYDGELIAETDECPFECAARQKFSILFDEPIILNANRWYVAWARISGPSSDCGSSGQSTITTEDGVTFYFKNSKKSNNGTDINAGQIPALLYKVSNCSDGNAINETNRNSYSNEQVFLLSRDFAMSVTPECFKSLHKLLRWSWNGLKKCSEEEISSIMLKECRHFTFVSCSVLHLLKVYINEVFHDNKRTRSDISDLAECISETRTLMKSILNERIFSNDDVRPLLERVMKECHDAFISCYNAFYPSPELRWRALCDLLVKGNEGYLLAAKLAALCSNSIRLASTFPLNQGLDAGISSPLDILSPTTGFTCDATNINLSDSILIEKMTEKTNKEGCHSGNDCSFQNILMKLLEIVSFEFQCLIDSNTNDFNESLIEYTCDLLYSLVSELIAQVTGVINDVSLPIKNAMHVTPSRFTKVSNNRTWSTGNGSPDAICFTVDKPDISIIGVTVYCSSGSELNYELELLGYHGNDGTRLSNERMHRDSWGHQWFIIDCVKGTYGAEKCDIVEVKFERPIPIRKYTKYAIRFRNFGSKTSNGDGGLTIVQGVDGSNWTFSDCPLSFNGTNHLRGQIPQILYYSQTICTDNHHKNFIDEFQARKNILSITESLIILSLDLFNKSKALGDKVLLSFSNSKLVMKLLPSILSLLAPLVSSDLKGATAVLSLIRKLLPSVCDINKIINKGINLITTSKHYIVVESDHPYKPASISNYRVKFPKSVKWMSLEFDSASGTSQNEDILQIYISSMDEKENKFYCPVLRKFSGPPSSDSWPSNSLILPGREVLFSLETASDYVKNDKAYNYGFRCQLIGYEDPNNINGYRLLEQELEFLASTALSFLLNKNLILPTIETMYDEAIIKEKWKAYKSLLGKGLVVSHFPTIKEALDCDLPLADEKPFLKDFIGCICGTSGGRLAAWLQPESYVDPSRCEVICNFGSDLKCGWSTVITIISKDQYGSVVNVPNLKVEVFAQPFHTEKKKSELDYNNMSTFTNVPYSVTVRDKMLFHAITMMKCYEEYSFEELRLLSPLRKRTTESMLVRPNEDGTFSANWTPSSAGWYQLKVLIDGIAISGSINVKVDEAPKGLAQAFGNGVQFIEPTCLRKFVGEYSAGLRIRTLPSLQSEQIGVIPVGSIIAITGETKNDDGLWVRLSLESANAFCDPMRLTFSSETWAIAYSNQLKKTYLVPVKSKPNEENFEDVYFEKTRLKNDNYKIKLPNYYNVVRCDPKGHNIQTLPSLFAPTISVVPLGTILKVVQIINNSDGIWFKLDNEYKRKFCDSENNDAWTLGVSSTNIIYLAKSEVDECNNSKLSYNSSKDLLSIGVDRVDSESDSLANSKNSTTSSYQTPFLSTTQKNDKNSPIISGRVAELSKAFSTVKKVKAQVKEEMPDYSVNVKELVKIIKSREESSLSSTSSTSKRLSLSSTSGSLKKSGESFRSSKNYCPLVNECRDTLVNYSEHGHESAKFQRATSVKSTQTSPSESSLSFDIESSKSKEISEKIFYKNIEEERPIKSKKFVKEAMSHSIAECLRAIFSAFIWHEGILHDAMACASYLKFNPDLTKEKIKETRQFLSFKVKYRKSLNLRDRKKFRHSLEVSQLTAVQQESYNNGNLILDKDLNENESSDKEDEISKECNDENIPQTLIFLLILWEELSNASLLAIAEPPSTLTIPLNDLATTPVQMFNRILPKPTLSEKSPKKRAVPYAKESSNYSNGYYHMETKSLTSCELCGHSFPYPVTHHMRKAHPGCGNPAGGKGYNSSGSFGEGWAGLCGDGGIGCSNWYLVCDNCRNEYLKEKKNLGKVKECKGKTKLKFESPVSACEVHSIMKENALFLLKIDSASNTSHEIESNDNEFENLKGFQCLESLGVAVAYKARLAEENLSANEILTLQNGLTDRGQKSIGIKEFTRSISMNLEDELEMISTTNSDYSGSSVVFQPSSYLLKLMNFTEHKKSYGSQGSENSFPFNRPVMSFILQHNDLIGLNAAIRDALRKVSIRCYALQALNWFLRIVTQPVSLHDLMWSFVCALTPKKITLTEKNERNEKTFSHDSDICQHPLDDLIISKDGSKPLQEAFHAVLQTIADIMPLLPMGSSLQAIAIKCFCLKFDTDDHSFLHRCHVFSNISNMLSRSEIDFSDISEESNITIETLNDITGLCEIKVSSRQAMVGALTDNSTETFWESGDEDRGKLKGLIIVVPKELNVKVVYIHVDNVRDVNAKVGSIVVKAGESAMIKLKNIEVDTGFSGWISCLLYDRVNLIRLELKGPDNSCRIRQIRVLGDGAVKEVNDTALIQQTYCEGETLRVFRLLTSQVFGKLISGIENESNNEEKVKYQESEFKNGNDDNELREHMVGILFSSSNKLSHLQKQICFHIMQSIRMETLKVREEWEALLCSKSGSVSAYSEIPSDAYCFELLSMVLALSGSNIGCQYLASQSNLLLDLFSLLHTGSARVQRQVISLLKRVLPLIQPSALSNILGVRRPDQTIKDNEFDIYSGSLLDIFLSCISKSLIVQKKVKGFVSKKVSSFSLATAIHPKDFYGNRWWMRGCMSRKLSQMVISLLQDMSEGKMNGDWSLVTKAAISESILNLTKLPAKYRMPNECLKTPTLWLALASLCVIDSDQAEILSSRIWVGDQGNSNKHQRPPRPFCDNHDDNETFAIILCTTCGNLCSDCDRFLHFHRKTHSHQRQIFKEEEEAIKVNIHEGCGRAKLFWLIALADSKSLKAMVEFRGETDKEKFLPITKSRQTITSGVCRFCGTTSNTGLLAFGNVCGDRECIEHAKNCCGKLLVCGHECNGIKGETICLPCLAGCVNGLKQDGDDMCMICFTEALSAAPVIKLKCGHLFHMHCVKEILQARWPGPRITFAFSLCPICKEPIEHDSEVLSALLVPIRVLWNDVKRKALMRLEYEGLNESPIIKSPGSKFFGNALGYAMERYAYYVCCKCNKAYYGGEARCDNEVANSDYDPKELMCGGCSDVSRARMCPKHGMDFLEYKCRYCCSVAVFFCFGTTHFCNACHDDFQKMTNIAKNDLPKCPAGPRAKQLEGEECPLHIRHPPTGEEFALGCGVCRNAHTF